MAHCLHPANVKLYDLFSALAQQEPCWPMNSKVATGDVVYTDLAVPFKQCGFVTEVSAINIPLGAIINRVRPFLRSQPAAEKQQKLFMQLRVSGTVPN